jgi:hypothetical protein
MAPGVVQLSFERLELGLQTDSLLAQPGRACPEQLVEGDKLLLVAAERPHGPRF